MKDLHASLKPSSNHQGSRLKIRWLSGCLQMLLSEPLREIVEIRCQMNKSSGIRYVEDGFERKVLCEERGIGSSEGVSNGRYKERLGRKKGSQLILEIT